MIQFKRSNQQLRCEVKIKYLGVTNGIFFLPTFILFLHLTFELFRIISVFSKTTYFYEVKYMYVTTLQTRN